MNKSDAEDGVIIPFAQSDMAKLFLEGLYPKYDDFVGHLLSEILNEKSGSIVKDYINDDDQRLVERARRKTDNSLLLKKLREEFSAFRQIAFINPLMKTVDALPKEEMALIAKSIVELTALRRKFTSSLETVGGAVDIALISKSDGFIWIDRKHYFSIDFNREFMDRKRLNRGDPRDCGGEHETATGPSSRTRKPKTRG